MRVGIVGCGLIGRRRAQVLGQSHTDQLVVVADVDVARAETMAKEHDCRFTKNWREVAEQADVQAIIVSTPNKWLAPVTVEALQNGKHVLCEKPPGRNVEEARRMIEKAEVTGKTLKIGFNHRHHSAIQKAHELLSQGAIGQTLFTRCRYGHGGRPGYDKEWRGNPEQSGGGELLDQGIHVLDLFRWFVGDFAEAVGFTGGYVWTGVGAGVEDNVFALFRTAGGQVASMHTSWTQWKNPFSFEVFAREGYLIGEGLGGSYGPERLTWGRRRPESGPPHEDHFDFPGPDESWRLEWEEFSNSILEGRQPLGNGYDGWKAMQLVEAVYESARTGRIVKLKDKTSSIARAT